MKRPFFSILIATYNRAEDVSFAIKQILAQNFADYEIIICDDNSTDNTQQEVKKFSDSRIRYYKNKKNLGAIYNIGKVLSYAKGEYVFLHGDDDYLLYDDILEKTAKRFKKDHGGLIRWNYLYQSFDRKDVYDYFRNKFTKTSLSLPPGKSAHEVVNFLEKFDIYFISGIVFKNTYPKKIKIIESQLSPWFEVCFHDVSLYGGYYDNEYAIVASWSQPKKHPEYFVTTKGELAWENFYNDIKRICGQEIYRSMLSRQLAISVSFLTTIKLYSNNDNLLLYAKRVRDLNPTYRTSTFYWCMLTAAYLCPKWLLRLVRGVYIHSITGRGKVIHAKQILKRIYQLRNFS